MSAFNTLPSDEQQQVLNTLRRIREMKADWAASGARRLPGNEPEYVVPVNDSLRVIVYGTEPCDLKVIDFVRHATLVNTFGAIPDAHR